MKKILFVLTIVLCSMIVNCIKPYEERKTDNVTDYARSVNCARGYEAACFCFFFIGGSLYENNGVGMAIDHTCELCNKGI